MFPGEWDIIDVIVLASYFKCNSSTIRKIVNTFENLHVYCLQSLNINQQSIVPKHAYSIDDLRSKASEYLYYHNKNGISILSLYCDEYPLLLKEIEYPPVLLYVKGIINNDLAIAIIGTRKHTIYGSEITKQFTEVLVHHRITIVSGLANGIDSIAHKTTLQCKGITYAIIASGIDSISPFHSNVLANSIIESGGVLISEYPLGTKAMPAYFPQRNRLISGVSKAVIIVESARKGGSMITCQFAFDQNREIYAIPGSLKSSKSEGPNLLINQNKASLAMSPEDILKDFNIKTEIKQQRIPILKEEILILTLLSDSPKQIDELSSSLHINSSTILAYLLSLEFNGYVKQLPGKFFMKL
jgi:DNA processing protein